MIRCYAKTDKVGVNKWAEDSIELHVEVSDLT